MPFSDDLGTAPSAAHQARPVLYGLVLSAAVLAALFGWRNAAPCLKAWMSATRNCVQ